MNKKSQQQTGQKSAAGRRRTKPAQPAPQPAPQIDGERLAGMAQMDAVLGRQLLTAAQQTLGNRQTSRLLVQRQAAGGPTQADQEEKARKSTKRIKKILKKMRRSNTAIISNTAQLFSGGSNARLNFKTMTVRSDSAALLAAGGHDPTKKEYFFYGEKQDNQHLMGKRTVGTVEGDSTLIIRETYSSGRKQSRDDLIATIVHEGSHMLTEVYGDYPASSGDADSFDRYKDEFRAYWIEPVGSWSKISDPDEKARRIKEHLVGTSATSNKGYTHLQNKYWSDATFKAKVDAHTRPDGYNLQHNPNLDRLAVLINGVKEGTETVDNVLLHIVRYMTPAERREAVNNDYFKINNQAHQALGAEFARVKNTLRDLSKLWFDEKLDPNHSRKMRYFLSAIAVRNETAIKVNYGNLTAKEKGRLKYDAAPYLVFVDQRIDDNMLRAAVYALMTGHGTGQFNATKALLQACQRARTDGDTAMPADIRAAFNRMTLESRLSLYRLAEPARRQYVDVLPDAISRPLLQGLRADRDTI